MIIGIDASALLSPHPTGVEIVTTQLIRTLLKLDQTNIYWLYSPKPLPSELFTDNSHKNIVVPGKRFWTQWHLSRVIKRTPPDIFWSPSHVLPNLPQGVKAVATIHDLSWYLFPQSYTWKNRYLSWLTVRKAIKRAQHLIAVSQQTKKDLKRFFAVPGENIAVVPHALRQDWPTSDFITTDKYAELGEYLLYVGRIELHKNILNILQAFSEFGISHPQTKLVLAGNPGFGVKKIKQKIAKLKLTNQVVLLSYVASADLPLLYRKSLGVLFPSEYEGFGLTILEGFASQVPVLTSRRGAMQEVAGGAALLVDPDSTDEINLGLHRLVDDPEFRTKLINKGVQRLQDFSWEISAGKIIDLWKTL